MNFPRELRASVLPLLVASAFTVPARGLIVFNDGHDHVYVTGTATVTHDSNIFGNNLDDGDTLYSASVMAEYTRRAGWIGVNASLSLESTRFGSHTSENFDDPKFSAEFTKLNGRTTGSLTLNAERDNRADPTVNVRTDSWAYAAGLNAKYPVIDRYTLAGGVNYSFTDYTDNRLYTDQRSLGASVDLFYVLRHDRDLIAGYRFRDNESSRHTGSVDHAFMLGVNGTIVRGYSGSVRFGYQYREPKHSADSTFTGWTGSATVGHNFTKKLTMNLQASEDFSTTATNIDIDRTTLSADLQHSFNARWSVHGGVDYGHSRFLGKNGIIPSMGRNRVDTFFNANAGIGYTKSEHFKIRLDCNWSENWSTLQYSDFIRQSWSLSVTSRW